MARLLIDQSGHRVVDVVGGRSGHAKQERDDLRGAYSEALNDGTLTEAAVENIERALDDYPDARPLERITVPRDLDVMAQATRAAGTPSRAAAPFPIAVVCPRCHRPANVLVVSDGGRWGIVLV
jgi:hypothetical protein